MATRLEWFAGLVHTQLVAAGEGSVERAHGQKALFEHRARRRIVWLSPGGTIQAPKQGGGRLPADGTQERNQSCKTRIADVQAHIFAEDDETTERLLDAVIAAVCTVAEVITMTGYRWMTEDQANAGNVLRNHWVMLNISLPLPVAEEIKPLRVIEAVEHDCGTIDANGNFVPQP